MHHFAYYKLYHEEKRVFEFFPYHQNRWKSIVEYEEPVGVDFFSNWNVSPEDYQKIKYWITNKIDTSGLDSCRKALLRKLIGKINNSPIGVLLTDLDKAIGEPSAVDKFKVNFKTRPLNNKDANTEYPSYNETTHEFEVDIVLDSATAKNATELYIASCFIHELVHAYLTHIWMRIFRGVPVPIDSLGHAQVFNAYIDTMKNRNRNQIPQVYHETEQHNYMADKLLEFMADLLEKFDNGGITSKRYYWYMSWGGLVRPKVKTWNYHWPNYPNWPPSNPAPVEDSTRGLKYALTLSRIDSIYNVVLENESKALSGALGRKPVPGGCY